MSEKLSTVSTAPAGLSQLEYARHLLEEVLGWPSKGNLELVADCLTSISKAKHLSLVQSHAYMQRALRLAREQGVAVDQFFFRQGSYMEIRPKENGDRWDLEQRRREAYAKHGCDSGWVYTGKGVARCGECERNPIR